MKKYFFTVMMALILCLSATACESNTENKSGEETDDDSSPTYRGVLLNEAEIPENRTEFEFTEDMKLAEFDSVGDNLSLNMKIYNDDHQQINVDVELFGLNAVPQYSAQASEWLAESLSSAHEVWLEWPYEWSPDWDNEPYLWCNVWSDDILVQDVLVANGWAEEWS